MPASPKARDHYETATCSALLGEYLFRDLGRATKEAPPGEPLQICAGDRVWIACPAGLPDVFKTLDRLWSESEGMRSSDFPEDWGVVANAAGEVTHRAGTNGNGGVWQVKYLGHQDGDLVDTPLNISEIGIDPVDPRLGEKYSIEHP